MKLSTIPNVYRNVNRAREIVSVLSKYGLADWISRFNLDFAKNIFKDPAGEALARHTREARIRMALSELGPTFIKLGQLLSTRPDLVGAALAGELEKLQTSAPADPAAEVHQTIADDLGQSVEQIFRHFTDEPIASASIGQVHAATLKTGEQVVVKVQHTGIAKTIRKDIDVMSGLAQLAERIPEFAVYRPAATLAEFQRTLLRELDFGREERNLQQFAARFADDPAVHIPQPITELCTPRVLTMERIEGVKLTDVTGEINSGLDPEKLARSGANLYLEMIFVDGHYHADPHPGNLLIQPGNVIGLLDFGMVGRIEESLREDIEEMMFALVQSDSIHLASIISRLGKMPTGLDKTSFRADVEDFVSHYAGQSLGHFDLSAALTEMADMIFRYKIILPPQVSMLLKTLITLEGTAKLLHPSFSILEVMRPFQRRALFRRFSPQRRIRKIRRAYMEMEHLMAVFPRRMMEILDQVQSGTFDVHLDHRGLGPSINRLVLGMLTSALFLGSSLMLSRQVPPLLFQTPMFMGLHNVSILGLSGCTISILIGLRLLRAIVKSGHLDPRD
jgi:ubiquinone biosynthesis protein